MDARGQAPADGPEVGGPGRWLGFSGHREWVYPKAIGGRFQRIHRLSGVLLQAFLILAPWVTLGGLPAVRADLPNRRLYLLGTVYTASDGFLLVILALLAAFSLFFFTALLGRMWCGYACPQTVFLEEWVRPLERWIEGDRSARMRRDRGPWTFDRAWRKGAKWAAFAALAVFIAGSLMSWFAGPRALWTGAAGPVDYALTGILAAGLFLDWAWFREQLCTYVCPYARFQSALTDDHSIVIAYDAERGEPRSKGKAAAQAGSCIDCGKCAMVCPQGIDIRDGFQLECINCARCVDACEDVMPRLGHPSLVRYTTIAADSGDRTRLIRPRTVAYAALLTGLTLLLFTLTTVRPTVEVTVNRAPGTLYQIDADGAVRNTFMVAVGNNDPRQARTYTVHVEGVTAEVMAPPLQLAPLENRTIPVAVRVPPEAAQPGAPIRVVLTTDGDRVAVPATLAAPRRNGGAI